MDFLKLLKPTAQVSRNAFDLSRKHVFSTKAGQARPVLALETVPNDFFEIDLAGLMRSQTLATAAFLRGSQRYDFFFVPNVQTWHPFNQFITQRKDVHSSRQRNSTYCPVVQLYSLLKMIREGFAAGSGYDVFGYDVRPVILENLQLLGYGDWRFILDLSDEDWVDFLDEEAESLNKYVNIFRLAAYQHIWYDYYRNKYFDLDTNDDTGGISTYSGDYSNDPAVTMFNFDDIDCGTFANSIISCNTSISSDVTRWARILKPRYIQWKKDLFTSALPGQQFGAVSSVNIGGSFDWTHSHSISAYSDSGIAIPNFIGEQSSIGDGATTNFSISDNALSISSGGQTVSLDTEHSHYIDLVTNEAGSTVSNLGSFDVLNLRKAEMLQAWKQATLRAGNMTDDQFKAHYGVEPYYDSDENVRFLGSFSQRFDINPVEATAATSSDGNDYNFNVGDIAATGRAVISGNKIKFECKDFGVIMCIASFLPEAEYEACGLDKANTLHEQFDYFTPEFQNIGLEAVDTKQFYPYGEPTHVLGYAPRYWMYKTAVDKVFGEFSTSRYTYSSVQKDPSLPMWVTPRHPALMRLGGIRSRSNFYVDPKVLDSIFYVASDNNPNTDQFLHNVYFDIKAIRPMSVLGLPQF